MFYLIIIHHLDLLIEALYSQNGHKEVCFVLVEHDQRLLESLLVLSQRTAISEDKVCSAHDILNIVSPPLDFTKRISLCLNQIISPNLGVTAKHGK